MTAAREVPQKRIRLVAGAICRFADGTTQKLWATRLSPSGAWILAVEPPRVGELIELSLAPLGLPALPPIKARVIRAEIDFAVAEKNGFEVSFVALDDKVEDLVVSAIIGIDERRATAPAFSERRGALRINTRLAACARTPDGIHHGIVADLSLTGAMLTLSPEVPESSFVRGNTIGLTITATGSGAPLDLEGRIAWSTLTGAQRLMGIQFADLNPQGRTLLQQILLEELARSSAVNLQR
jgi:hypothetical protein